MKLSNSQRKHKRKGEAKIIGDYILNSEKCSIMYRKYEEAVIEYVKDHIRELYKVWCEEEWKNVISWNKVGVDTFLSSPCDIGYYISYE